MKVQLEKSFAMPASADVTWALLQDIERVAGCMPGAKITERIDDQHYKGTVSVKFGPASMTFRGNAEVKALDPQTRSLRLFANGADTTGSSGASMDLTARVEAVNAMSSNLVGTSEVSMSGKAAAFGGRMMNTVADQVLNQFAANFAAQVQALQAQQAQAAVDAPGSGPASATAPTPAPEPQPQPAAAELNGFAVLRALLRDWLRNLFRARKA
jgi:uncharacterized protein